MTSCSAGYRYDVDIGIEFDTIPTNERTNRYTLEYAISIFDGWKLSFKICTKNTGTPGDGGQDTFDTIDRIFDISIFQDIETSDTNPTLTRGWRENTFDTIYRNFDISIYRSIKTFDTISYTSKRMEEVKTRSIRYAKSLIFDISINWDSRHDIQH